MSTNVPHQMVLSLAIDDLFSKQAQRIRGINIKVPAAAKLN